MDYPPGAIHAIVLSGGGAFGAYEVGILKALCQTGGIDPHVYTGTSVGSFNAAVMCQGGEGSAAIAKLEQSWLNDIVYSPSRGGNGVYRLRCNPLEFANLKLAATHPAKPFLDLASDLRFFLRLGSQKVTEFLLSKDSFMERTVDLVDIAALISVQPFHHLVRKVVNLEAIRKSGKALRIVATRWDHGDERHEAARIFTNEDMTDAHGHTTILASAAIPTLFPAICLNGHYFVDGGIAMNTPVAPAVRAGATVVHIIDLEPDIGSVTMEDLDSTVAGLLRTLSVAVSSKIRQEIDRVHLRNRLVHAGAENTTHVTVHRYHPHQPLGGPLQMLDFASSYVQDLIGRGYRDALAHDCVASGCVL